jgi:RND superfamily putative drug exporter
MFERLAQLALRRGKSVVIGAVMLSIVAGALGAGVADRLGPYAADDPATESVKAADRLEEAGYREASVIVLVDGVGRADDLARRVAADPDVVEVAGYHTTRSRDFVSRDGESTYLAVSLAPTDDKEIHDVGERIAHLLEDEPGVAVGGSAIAERQANEQVEQDLRTAELYAFPILFLLSLLFFRSLVAAALPLLVGGLTIVCTMFAMTVVSELGTFSVFALNLVIGLGLGLAIDYSLFVVSRYREEIAKTGPGLHAMRRTMATAGRTVLFSALTVAGAIASLLVFPQRFLDSMGVGGTLTALIAAAVALIVLPAILALLGNRVNALAPAALRQRAEREAQPDEQGLWYRLSRLVMRVPGRIAIASAALLIALGLPFLDMKVTTVDAQVLPADASAHRVDDRLRAEFPPFRATPIRLAVEGDAAEAERVARAAAKLDGVADVRQPTRLDRDDHVIEVISSSPPLTDESEALVADLRALDGDALTNGSTASFVDLKDSLADHLPLMLAIVIAVTIAVLFAFTGSLVLPVKQIVMNLLGLSAVFGILVLVFQDGRFESLLGYTSNGALDATQPLFLFAVAFGLSTDYGVFLLSRIKEARDRGAGDREAVAIGLERVGRIATAAAVLFAVAIGAFVTSEMVFIKQLGLGTALAVLIDATIVRALLVPSLMEMLGRWNWWAPKPLRRLHARLGFSET